MYMVFFFVCSILHAKAFAVSNDNDCVKVPPMCKKLISPNYTKMRLPNMLNHTRYEDVAADIKVWTPLLNSSKCNAGNQLKYFLCFTYAPVCVDKLISPCKSLCETVRDSCSPVMAQHNYSWPSFFNCNQKKKFHDDSSQMCINLKMLGIEKQAECSCKNSYNRKTLKSLVCKSELVLSGWVTKPMRQGQIEVKASKLKAKHHSQKLLPLILQVSNTKKHCRCNKLRIKKKPSGSGRYLIVASNVGGKIRVDAMKRFKKPEHIVNMLKHC